MQDRYAHPKKELSGQHLAIIGASYLQLPLIEKARSLGYTTHVFAWKADDVGEKAADFFYPISIVEKEAIAEECEKIGICGICSIASDLAVITVNYVADRLGLPCNPPEITPECTDKYEMRKALAEHNDPVPAFRLIRKDDPVSGMDLSFSAFPLIVKPTDRSGSRGVSIIHSAEELPNALENALKESFGQQAVLEEYVPGAEYSLEGISYQGSHRILAVTQKLTTGAPHFVETGHLQPAGISSAALDRASSVVLHALDSLGIQNGASHSEIKIADDGTVTIIEIGARMGGDCIGSDLVPLTTGIDYMKAVIDIACGKEPDLSPRAQGVPASVHYILNAEDEMRMQAFQNEHPDRFYKLVFLNREMYGYPDDSSGRAGCYITIHDK